MKAGWLNLSRLRDKGIQHRSVRLRIVGRPVAGIGIFIHDVVPLLLVIILYLQNRVAVIAR